MATELSRRAQHAYRESNSPPEPLSRTAIKRMADERRMERKFAWAFSVILSLTTLYLIWRLPWGHHIPGLVIHFVESLQRI
jgi:hypothetical protein